MLYLCVHEKYCNSLAIEQESERFRPEQNTLSHTFTASKCWEPLGAPLQPVLCVRKAFILFEIVSVIVNVETA